jgi:hypothetical protein
MIQRKDLDRMREAVAEVAGLKPKEISVRDYIGDSMSFRAKAVLNVNDINDLKNALEENFTIVLPNDMMSTIWQGCLVKDMMRSIANIVKKSRVSIGR